jgi:hypothetical protein
LHFFIVASPNSHELTSPRVRGHSTTATPEKQAILAKNPYAEKNLCTHVKKHKIRLAIPGGMWYTNRNEIALGLEFRLTLGEWALPALCFVPGGA